MPWMSLFITIVTLAQCECTSCDSTEYPHVSISVELQYVAGKYELNKMSALRITSNGFINFSV
jgi:hypothetical protein